MCDLQALFAFCFHVARHPFLAAPTLILIDRKAIIRHAHNGFYKKNEASMLERINELLRFFSMN